MTQRIAVYPGTFDPVTYGHIDVVHRATELFSRVIVLVARNSTKQPMFDAEERVAMIREVFRARRRRATVIVRGLRAVSDFEFEFQLALTNRKLAPQIDTVFLMPHEKYTYLNSSIVREVARLGGDVSGFVPPAVRRRLLEKVA